MTDQSRAHEPLELVEPSEMAELTALLASVGLAGADGAGTPVGDVGAPVGVGGCLACGGPVPDRHGDWCGRACRAALRRYGSTLAPTGTRHEQLDAALAQRRVLAGLGVVLPETFRCRG